MQKYDKEYIIECLEKAVMLIELLPDVKPNTYKCIWPKIKYTDFELYNQAPEFMKLTILPEDFKCIDKVNNWIKIIPDIKHRHVIWMRASGMPLRILCHFLRCSHTHTLRIWNQNIEKIVNFANKEE